MRIGFIATRLSGTDGVTLEVEKWSHCAQTMGHELYFCAGELGSYAKDGTLIPKLHFADRSIQSLSRRAFEGERLRRTATN
jgi:mannosylglucosylglycerate synthase